jgi:hypothetical protein
VLVGGAEKGGCPERGEPREPDGEVLHMNEVSRLPRKVCLWKFQPRTPSSATPTRSAASLDFALALWWNQQKDFLPLRGKPRGVAGSRSYEHRITLLRLALAYSSLIASNYDACPRQAERYGVPWKHDGILGLGLEIPKVIPRKSTAILTLPGKWQHEDLPLRSTSALGH